MRALDRYISTRATRDLKAEAAPYRSRAVGSFGKITSVPRYVATCSCANRPKCQMYGGCENYADGSAIVWGTWFPRITFTWEFTCKSCWAYFSAQSKKPIPGFTRPEWADAEWKPSIDAVIDLALREINQRERREHEKRMRDIGEEIDDSQIILQKGAEYSPEQLKQLIALSQATRELRKSDA